jgi:hypothetical protein
MDDLSGGLGAVHDAAMACVVSKASAFTTKTPWRLPGEADLTAPPGFAEPHDTGNTGYSKIGKIMATNNGRNTD